MSAVNDKVHRSEVTKLMQSSPQIPSPSGRDVTEIHFADSRRLVARTRDGGLLLYDMDHPCAEPTTLQTDVTVSSVHIMPIPVSVLYISHECEWKTELSDQAKAVKIAPASRSTSTTQSTRPVRPAALGDAQNAINIESRVTTVAPSLKSMKGSGSLVHTDSDKTKGSRTVSAPSRKSGISQPSSRSASHPVSHRPRPSSSMGIRASVAPIEEEEEVGTELPLASARSDVEAGGEASVDLGWALREPVATCPNLAGESVSEDAGMEELRQELGRMQIDMLRLGRLMKVSF